jgi:hypothetical protein
MAERAITGNASSGKQARRGRQLENRRHQQMLNDAAEVIATDAGARLLHRLLDRWSAFAPVFHPKPTTLAYRSGRQSVAIELMRLLDEVPGSFARILALREGENRENASVSSQPIEEESDDE